MKTFLSTRFVIAVFAMSLATALNLAGRIDGGNLTTIFVTAISLFGIAKTVEYWRGRNGDEK